MDQQTQNDTVQHPAHYTQSGVECIEAIEAALGEEQFKGYLRGNIMKYLWRYPYKNGSEDLLKGALVLAQPDSRRRRRQACRLAT